jgi:peptide/nickel transport system permease protein
VLPLPGGPPDVANLSPEIPAPFGVPAPSGGIAGARSLRRMARAVTANRKATAGAILLVIFCLVGLFPGVIAHDNPNAEIYPRSLGPSAHHLLGTTAFGQDMFAQVIYGTRPVLEIALAV